MLSKKDKVNFCCSLKLMISVIGMSYLYSIVNLISELDKRLGYKLFNLVYFFFCKKIE